ncbi:MAG: YeeE/YedE family protein [Burkholderiales bacterium]|nr:YeeE/YedE family protein [Burkholderiales bacterium]
MYTAASFAAGLVFGFGLIVAGMANPAKVLAFLDLSGNWDPSLALVMAGAIVVGAGAFALMRGKRRSLLGAPLLLPTARDIDRRLVIGSLVFGIGWGLAGICPGPALVLAGTGIAKGWIFLAAMLAGNAIFEVAESAGRRARKT